MSFACFNARYSTSTVRARTYRQKKLGNLNRASHVRNNSRTKEQVDGKDCGVSRRSQDLCVALGRGYEDKDGGNGMEPG